MQWKTIFTKSNILNIEIYMDKHARK